MSVIPQKTDINSLFGTKEFYIDFYQREYKWKKDHVIKLLDDIFHRFDLDYDSSKDANNENISKYDWYYLSSFITNIYQGNTYILDGQQRLTTLTLMMVSLYHLADKFNTGLLKKVIESKIFGATTSGLKYWMGQDGRAPILMELVRSQKTDVSNGNISYTNMLINYKDINDYLDSKLNSDHRFSCFVLFFLHRIFLVHIDIS